MAAVANYINNKNLYKKTFNYVNCAPQNKYLNRGPWMILEIYCRKLLRDRSKCDTLYWLQGQYFSHKNTKPNNLRILSYKNK
jgi:DNA/RNA endonuclease G (NUC1)